MEILILLFALLSAVCSGACLWLVKAMESETHQMLRQVRATRDILEMSRRSGHEEVPSWRQ